MEKKVYRIIDANYNRAREGIRVCEDILRFMIPAQNYALKLKKIRHNLSKLVNKFGFKKLLSARDTESDKIKFIISEKKDKLSYQELWRRNSLRVSEALRVLEEVSLLIRPELKKEFMRLRFKFYQVEKEISGG